MYNKVKSLKNKFKTRDNQRLFSNFLSLSVLQWANYILPLLTIPYLIRVLGIEYFGLLAFASAVIVYFNIITDYGFNLTATREISIHRDNREKIIEIFSVVMTIKFILMGISFILLSILLVSFEKFSINWEIYFFTFGIVVGQALFPVWFFQGMEQMKYITYLNILSKTIFTVAIFIFVQEQRDYYMVPILTSIGFIIAGIWSLFLIKKEFDIKFQIQPLKTIKYYLIDGWDVFIVTIAGNLYESTNMVILGLFSSNAEVGYYSIIDRVKGVIRSVFAPVVQSFYPHLSKLIQEDRNLYYKKLNALTLYLGIVSIVIAVIVFLNSDAIVSLITGENNSDLSYYLKLFSLIIVSLPLGSLFGPNMLVIGAKKELNKIIVSSAFISLIISIPLAYLFGIVGLIISSIIIQYMIVLRLYLKLRMRNEIDHTV